MPATYNGGVTIGGFLPGVLPVLVEAQGSLELGVGTAQAELAGSAQALVNLEASLTDPTLYIQALIAGTVQAEANLTAAVPAVELGFQIAGATQIIANIELGLGTLTVSLDAVLALLALFGTAGLHAFSYQGELQDMGASLDAVTPASGLAGTDQVTAVVLLVNSDNSVAVSAMGSVFVGV